MKRTSAVLVLLLAALPALSQPAPSMTAHFINVGQAHPRRYTVELLASNITRNRSQPKTVMVATRAEEFNPLTVRRAIYATGWDGTVRVVARAANSISVFREH